MGMERKVVLPNKKVDVSSFQDVLMLLASGTPVSTTIRRGVRNLTWIHILSNNTVNIISTFLA